MTNDVSSSTDIPQSSKHSLDKAGSTSFASPTDSQVSGGINEIFIRPRTITPVAFPKIKFEEYFCVTTRE